MKRPLNIAFLLCLSLLSIGRFCRATDIGSTMVRCPVCHKAFSVNELLSWDSWLSPDGPPVIYDTCPSYLYTSAGDPPAHFSRAEATRVRVLLATLPQHLPPAVKAWLRGALATGFYNLSGNDKDKFYSYLAELCEAARAGKNFDSVPIPHFTAIESHDKDTLRDIRNLKALLPAMIRARLNGQPGPLPPEEGDRQMSALFSSAYLIQKGDARALQYFLLWVMQAKVSDLKEDDDAVAENLEAIGETRNLRWPQMDLSKSRVPLIADCIAYLRGNGALPASIVKRLRSNKWDELTKIALAPATGRCSREATAPVSEALAKHVSPADAVDPIQLYYERTGIPGDIPILERYARFTYPDTGDGLKSQDWYCGLRGTLESVIVEIRLRQVLGV